MKKIVLSAVVIAALSAPAFCGMFGMPSLPGAGSSQSAGNALSDKDIDLIFVAVKKGEELMSKSTIAITEILLGSKAKEDLLAKLAEAEKINDPKEKDAKKAKIYTDASTEVKKFAESKDGQEALKKLSSAQKTEAGKAIGNFALAGLVDLAAVKMGQSVVKRASADPMGAAVKYASKLSMIKDIIATVPAQATEIGKMSQQLFAIAKTGGLPTPTITDKQVTEVVPGLE
jgi:hypothetical protein